ncbi:hypothetical protein [Actinomadura madurae]|uniref:hypothetical protein n=1 Tax=Actinomadura madurae TaxID=1993 RepID=UPI0020D25CD0|nr:hypothetical protein [Actinomadura madurae]MCP9983883.1 hypothetical protein [Actinomadura madurae]MCQ0004546.1 hypothetical protein [Actinomadura madurae]
MASRRAGRPAGSPADAGSPSADGRSTPAMIRRQASYGNSVTSGSPARKSHLMPGIRAGQADTPSHTPRGRSGEAAGAPRGADPVSRTNVPAPTRLVRKPSAASRS